MQYKQAESRVCPQSVEAISDNRYLLRKNIREVERTDTSGETIKVWVYDEALASAPEYAAWQAVQSAEQLREAEIVDEYTLKLIEEGVL
jgi:hypothetical protein